MQKTDSGFPITLRRAEWTGADGKEREFLLAIEKQSRAPSLDQDLRSAWRFRPQQIQTRENALIDRGSHMLELFKRREMSQRQGGKRCHQIFQRFASVHFWDAFLGNVNFSKLCSAALRLREPLYSNSAL
jgi:hypothetical protein